MAGKRLSLSLLVGILLCAGGLADTGVRVVAEQPVVWALTTADSMSVLSVGRDGGLVVLHEGPRLDDPGIFLSGRRLSDAASRDAFPARGAFPVLAPSLEVVLPDGSREVRLVYDSHQITDEAGAPVLAIRLKDQLYPLVVTLSFRVRPEVDVIERWAVVSNQGPAAVLLENVASGNVILEPGRYDLLQLSGEWGREFTVERTALTVGAKILESRGMRFHKLSPWYLVRPSAEHAEEEGDVWFGALDWSGNWQLRFERPTSSRLQILGGINFWDTTWSLAPGASFETPLMVTGFCSEGPGGASRRLHRYIRRHVLPASFREEHRPVLYNSWYATYFDVTAAHQVSLAKVAADIGVELFVMDDGWFLGRKTDRGGLGDWSPDPDKFPSGLQPMISEIEKLGMSFGLWVEPEMVNPNSALYRTHPEWALHTPGRKPFEVRHQLVLNMARGDVKEFTIDWLTKLFETNRIRFLKWDFNRDIAEVSWPGVSSQEARELRIQYVRNVYDIHDYLRSRFPEVMIEGCAGGGGRVDTGILKRVDQVWTSDNTNPSDRLFIQHGFSHAFPANTMVSWTTDDDWRKAQPSLQYRFRVAMAGVLGVGNDLTRWGEEEKQIARAEIALYMQIRPLVQGGDLYRLLSPLESDRVALAYVSEDKSEAVVFMYTLADTLGGTREIANSEPRLRLRGLQPDRVYTAAVDGTGEFTGAQLMRRGLPWLAQGDYQARIVHLRSAPSAPVR
jgi:alpha-galactosidase